MSRDPEWLQTAGGQHWLDSADGHEWLETDEGNKWLVGTGEGLAWGRSAAGERYLDGLTQRGFDAYFSGEMHEPPPGWFTPETAPLIGSRVRLTTSESATAGTRFGEGELAIVAELVFMPIGAVQVRLRTIDGRKMITFTRDSITPA